MWCSLNSCVVRRVLIAVSELRPTPVQSKHCKMNTLSQTKYYTEMTVAKCTVFHSLCISTHTRLTAFFPGLPR